MNRFTTNHYFLSDMARRKRTSQETEIQDYRHEAATRKNNPPVGIASHGVIRETPKQKYAYNPTCRQVYRPAADVESISTLWYNPKPCGMCNRPLPVIRCF